MPTRRTCIFCGPTVKGYTVIDIEPKGEIFPLYSRNACQDDVAPMKTVTQVVPDRRMTW